MRRLALLSCALASIALAEEAPRPAPPPLPIPGPGEHLALELPVMDLPFNALHGGEFPSMQQSLMLDAGLGQLARHETFHFLERVEPPWGRALGALGAGGLDLVFFTWGQVWMHEEWHRAVMSLHGIPSFDDADALIIRDDSVSVSHVADADLIRLKRDFPADMVRLHEAGMEAEIELLNLYRKRAVFEGTDPFPDLISAWSSTLSVLGYRAVCAGTEADLETDEFNASEGANVAIRDFTGLDCTAWAYDLDRPQEPYEARGLHPSGVGLNRYIKYSQLTAEEQSMVRVGRNLALLNFASPFLLGIRGFSTPSPFDGKPLFWSAALRSHLTSYGQEVSVDLYVHRDAWNVFASYHHGMNERGGFPGIELGLWRYPLPIPGSTLRLSATAMAWLQPEGQSWHADKAAPGGLLRAKVEVPMSRFASLYLEAEAKSAGWVPGVVELAPAVNVRVGLVFLP